jgi:hypothetical protein
MIRYPVEEMMGKYNLAAIKPSLAKRKGQSSTK